MRAHILALLLPFFTLNALAIPNGIEIDESEYPEAVSLWTGTENMKSFFCSGSIVKANTKNVVLTAAHCARAAIAEMPKSQPNPFGVYVQYKNKFLKATDASYANGYFLKSRKSNGDKQIDSIQGTFFEHSEMDVGIVDFEQFTNIAMEAFELDFSNVNPDDPVTLVGYGANQAYTKVREKYKLETEEDFAKNFDKIEDKPYWEVGGGIKRKGMNQLQNFSIGDSLISITGHSSNEKIIGLFSKPTGEHVTFAPGDSGAPLLRDGKIIGICSGGFPPESGQREEHTANVVRITGEARTYIEEALQK